MDALILELSVLADAVTLELGGPDATFSVQAPRAATTPVLTVVGPPGLKGEDGQPGLPGQPGQNAITDDGFF